MDDDFSSKSFQWCNIVSKKKKTFGPLLSFPSLLLGGRRPSPGLPPFPAPPPENSRLKGRKRICKIGEHEHGSSCR